MIAFSIACAIYLSCLLFIRPTPASLKAVKPRFQESLKGIKATLVLGPLLLLIFLVTSDFTFATAEEELYKRLALRGGFAMQNMWPMQALTHLFVHINVLHVAANVTVLGLLSVYERRVGARRFLAVLGVASVASIPSALLYSNAYVSGISGGVFGLAAAYFTDHESLTRKEWLMAIAFFAFIVLVLSLDSALRTSGDKTMDFQIDHIGHVLGAIGGIVYCRLAPARHGREVQYAA